MIRNKHFGVKLMVACLVSLPTIVDAQTILGRWCDQMMPNSQSMNRVITIEARDDGSTYVVSKFFDGSALEQQVSEQGGGIFAVIESDFGDRYRVVNATGELQLIDDDGLIRTAPRLENVPQPNDCIR